MHSPRERARKQGMSKSTVNIKNSPFSKEAKSFPKSLFYMSLRVKWVHTAAIFTV